MRILIKALVILLVTLAIVGCERPATISNWSPLNTIQSSNATTAPVSNTAIPTGVTKIVIASQIPEFDLETMPDTLPHSLKGYELVSWQGEPDWNFTLITGTNRQKTFEELISPESWISETRGVKITVSGVEVIKQVLAHLPKGETVGWGGMNLSGQVPKDAVYFTYPPQKIMEELYLLAKENGFELFTLQETE